MATNDDEWLLKNKARNDTRQWKMNSIGNAIDKLMSSGMDF